MYSPVISRWIALVPIRSGSPGDCIEVEFTDVERIAGLQKGGMAPLDSLKRVLGL